MKYDVNSDNLTLIEGCLAREETAWEALVSKYEKLIYSTCRQYNLQQTEADDIFGRVCLLLLQNLGRVHNPASLTSWLMTTTSRECWHYKKKLRSLTSISARGEDDWAGMEDISDHSVTLPEEILLTLERQQKVREALKQLSPRCQKLIWYLFYAPDEPSYNQISSLLKLPVASIGPNRARCLAKLRVELEETGNKLSD